MPPLLASTLVRVEGCLPFFYLLRQNVKLQTDKQTRSLEFPLKWFDILVYWLIHWSATVIFNTPTWLQRASCVSMGQYRPCGFKTWEPSLTIHRLERYLTVWSCYKESTKDRN